MNDMRKFMDLSEARNPRNRFAKKKITIGVPNSVYKDISNWLAEYEDINVSPEEIMKNPQTMLFIERSFEYFLGDAFSEGWENMDLGAELGYESSDADDPIWRDD